MKPDKSAEYQITPPARFVFFNVRELWRYRDLFFALIRRDIFTHYKQTLLGIFWALIKPFTTMVVFSLIFNRVAGIESRDGTPYPVFLYTGLLLWQYLSATISNVSVSLINNSSLITKIYFPRLLIPFSIVVSGLLDFLISFLLLIAMMFYYGIYPAIGNFFIFLALLFCTLLLTMGLGCFFSAVNVKYRDVNHALPFLIQTMMFVTPVVYPLKMLDNYKFIQTIMIWLNPMAGIITNARLAMLGHGALNWPLFNISALMSMVIFSIGMIYFHNAERNFADVI